MMQMLYSMVGDISVQQKLICRGRLVQNEMACLCLVAIILLLLVAILSYDLLLPTHVAIPLREPTSATHCRMMEEKKKR